MNPIGQPFIIFLRIFEHKNKRNSWKAAFIGCFSVKSSNGKQKCGADKNIKND
jgi:hypothetical protein